MTKITDNGVVDVRPMHVKTLKQEETADLQVATRDKDRKRQIAREREREGGRREGGRERER